MEKQTVRIIGVPIDLGADRRGVDMGPSALRYAGLNKRLKDLGWFVEDSGNITVPIAETLTIQDQHLKYLHEIAEVNMNLCQKIAETLADGIFPLIIGGDHSLGIGTMAGCAKSGKRLGMMWFDTHGDFNSPDTTSSGNIHGMPLAVASGIGHPELTAVGGMIRKIRPENTVVIGARMLDPEEREALAQSGITIFSMSDIDRLGMSEIVNRGLEIASNGTEGIHVSFDLDVIDPSEAPGVGTPVPGGITFREAHLAMEMIAESRKMACLDVVEVNPILDIRNQTASLAVGLICSAFGQRIYP